MSGLDLMLHQARYVSEIPSTSLSNALRLPNRTILSSRHPTNWDAVLWVVFLTWTRCCRKVSRWDATLPAEKSPHCQLLRLPMPTSAPNRSVDLHSRKRAVPRHL